jgi:AcrR family transcriptional regulator
MPASSVRADKKAETRRRLIDAAAAVFGRSGFHGATVEAIAAGAGATTGALYWHFTGKEELFLAVADERVAQRVEEIRAVNDRGSDPAALEAEIERQFQAFIEREPEWPLLYYEFWAYGARDPHLREAFAQRRRAVQAAIAEGLEKRAAEYGVKLPIPAAQIAIGLNALMNGLAFERVADPDAVPRGLAGRLISRYLVGVLAGATPGDEEAPA